MITTKNQIEQAKEIVKLLEGKYGVKGNTLVNVDTPFQDLKRYTDDYTIVNCLFENVLDEIAIISENIKYDEETYDLTKRQAKSHLNKLKKFVIDNAKRYFEGEEVDNYVKQAEEA